MTHFVFHDVHQPVKAMGWFPGEVTNSFLEKSPKRPKNEKMTEIRQILLFKIWRKVFGTVTTTLSVLQAAQKFGIPHRF